MKTLLTLLAVSIGLLLPSAQAATSMERTQDLSHWHHHHHHHHHHWH